jgi:hypothetical protein
VAGDMYHHAAGLYARWPRVCRAARMLRSFRLGLPDRAAYATACLRPGARPLADSCYAAAHPRQFFAGWSPPHLQHLCVRLHGWRVHTVKLKSLQMLSGQNGRPLPGGPCGGPFGGPRGGPQ